VVVDETRGTDASSPGGASGQAGSSVIQLVIAPTLFPEPSLNSTLAAWS
jgi:hypothetical protein